MIKTTLLPEIFETSMKSLLGTEYEAFVESYNAAPVKGLRFNKLKNATVDMALLGGPVPWCKTGQTFPENIRPSKTLEYAGGIFYIQEPSAMCPAEVLNASPGDYVLDMCAAPGGKSVQIAGQLQGHGLLVSNDASPSRSRALVKNLERAGVTNSIVLTEMPKKIAEYFPNFFDKILVDAPCSGEGMFRRDPDAVKAYTANKPDACVLMQMDILHHAAILLKPGGLLVYSTCTFNPMENERVIEAFLESHKDFSIVKIDHNKLGISPGRKEWAKNINCSHDLSFTGRLWPHLINGEGHFVACLQKNEEDNNLAKTPSKKYKQEKFPKEFAEFCNLYLNNFNLNQHIAVHGASLYIQPCKLDLKGLRVARSGWYVGDIIRGRFTPTQSLAMGIAKEDARFSVNLNEEDAWRYLRGESLNGQGLLNDTKSKPWVLICYNNFPLGWAKLVQGRLKNQLPTGWVVK